MRSFNQILIGLIIASFVIILVASVVQQIIGYLIGIACLAVIFRALFQGRG